MSHEEIKLKIQVEVLQGTVNNLVESLAAAVAEKTKLEAELKELKENKQG